ncbi:Uncharacterised protein [Mycobacterium tuberculosis]|nr:Uncharacterised protein [Mycobacterium tuberculosis]
MTLPGFILPSGSQIRLNSRIARISSGPYWRSSSSPRCCPSPCSPDSDPPNEVTRSAASSMKLRYSAIPSGLRRSKLIREWMQPCAKCPYMAPLMPCLAITRRSART